MRTRVTPNTDTFYAVWVRRWWRIKLKQKSLSYDKWGKWEITEMKYHILVSYSQPCQAFEIGYFPKKVNGLKFHLRCLTFLWIRICILSLSLYYYQNKIILLSNICFINSIQVALEWSSQVALHEKCPYSDFFRSAFSRI